MKEAEFQAHLVRCQKEAAAMMPEVARTAVAYSRWLASQHPKQPRKRPHGVTAEL